MSTRALCRSCCARADSCCATPARPRSRAASAWPDRSVRTEPMAPRSAAPGPAGAGNSAGQEVVHLAGNAAKVWVLVRGQGREASMSRYLIGRIAGLPNVELVTQAQVSGLEGRDGVLEAIRWRHRTAEEVRRPI